MKRFILVDEQNTSELRVLRPEVGQHVQTIPIHAAHHSRNLASTHRHTILTWIRYRFRLALRQRQNSTHYLDLGDLGSSANGVARMRASRWSQRLHLGDPRAPPAKANRSIRSATKVVRQRQRGPIGTHSSRDLRGARHPIIRIDGASRVQPPTRQASAS